MTNYKFSATHVLHWLQWVVATTIGMAGAWTATAIVLSTLRPIANIDEDWLFGIVAALALGVFTGTLQWWILRTRIPQAWWWIVASISGYMTALALVSISNSVHLMSFEGPWNDIASLGFLGLVIGVPQYLVLRQRFRKAGWWVLGSALGMQSYLIGSAYPAHNSRELIGLGIMMGVVLGATTGIIMVWLLHANGRSKTSLHFPSHAT